MRCASGLAHARKKHGGLSSGGQGIASCQVTYTGVAQAIKSTAWCHFCPLAGSDSQILGGKGDRLNDGVSHVSIPQVDRLVLSGLGIRVSGLEAALSFIVVPLSRRRF